MWLNAIHGEAPLSSPPAAAAPRPPLLPAGRLAFRVLFDEQQDLIQVVHINEPSPIESTAYLLKYDSVHGEFIVSASSETSRNSCAEQPACAACPANGKLTSCASQAPGSMM
jgi:hypothetical protein